MADSQAYGSCSAFTLLEFVIQRGSIAWSSTEKIKNETYKEFYWNIALA
jgi:hypothetical protein